MWGTAALGCQTTDCWGGSQRAVGRPHHTPPVPAALCTAQRLLLQPQLHPVHVQGHDRPQQHDAHKQVPYHAVSLHLKAAASPHQPGGSSSSGSTSSSSSSSSSNLGSAKAEHERQAAASMRKLQALQAKPRVQQPQKPIRRQQDPEPQQQGQRQQRQDAPAVPQLRWRSSAIAANKLSIADHRQQQQQQAQQQPAQKQQHTGKGHMTDHQQQARPVLLGGAQRQSGALLEQHPVADRQAQPKRDAMDAYQVQQHTPADNTQLSRDLARRQPPPLQEPVVAAAASSPSIFPDQPSPFVPSPVLNINNGAAAKPLSHEIAAAFGAHAHVLLFTNGYNATWSAITGVASARRLLRSQGDPHANLMVQPTLRGGRAGVSGAAYALDVLRTAELEGYDSQTEGKRRELRVTGGGVNDIMRIAQTLAASVDSETPIVLKAAGEYAVVNALAAVALARRMVRSKQKQELAVMPVWEPGRKGARAKPALRLLVRVCDMGTGAMRVVDENYRAGRMQRQRAEQKATGSDDAEEDECW